ncbi:uncharacterized protein LOC116263290 [Nymphaea colorata]|nr:uncharacterized protein LOC116263290 [Nymphaea colorata]
MGSAGMRVIAAVALSGCSLLLMALKRRWILGGGREEKEPAGSSMVVYSLKSLCCEASAADAGVNGLTAGVVQPPPPAKSSSGKKKKVSFSGDVEEPSSNNVEYRGRHVRVSTGKRRREKRMDLSRVKPQSASRCELPANRRALYHAMSQFHSQRATAVLYA